jgi:hypothetical protein
MVSPPNDEMTMTGRMTCRRTRRPELPVGETARTTAIHRRDPAGIQLSLTIGIGGKHGRQQADSSGAQNGHVRRLG